MLERSLGRTGRRVSVVGLGTWQLGADWGSVPEHDARAVLEASADAGVTFFDTADVYGTDAVSRSSAGSWRRARTWASPSPRRWAAAWSRCRRTTRRPTSGPGSTGLAATWGWTDSTWCSCTARPPRSSTTPRRTTSSTTWSSAAPSPPTGSSVETVDQAMSAIARPTSPRADHSQRLPPQAPRPRAAGGDDGRGRIIARVPLASGPAVRPLRRRHGLRANDHRSYNRHGEVFDVGRPSPAWTTRRA